MPAVRMGNLPRWRKSFESFDSPPLVIAGGKNFLRLDQIHQMMRDAALVGRGNFRGADVEMPIDLRGIADEDFAVRVFRQG